MGNCTHRQRAVPLIAARFGRPNTPEESVRARRNWRRVAAKLPRLHRYLRLRLYFHYIGEYLKQPHIQSLFLGVERVRGKVTRTRPAAQALQARVRKAASRAAAKARLP